ncbi:GNAT family N-acetyltransferase [Microbacterium sp. NPDC089318]
MEILTFRDETEVHGPEELAAQLVIKNDEIAEIYEATIDGTPAAGVVYRRTGKRVSILATAVFPEFRGRGIAAALLAHVLDDIRDRNERVSVSCPFTAQFLDTHAEYSDLIEGSAHNRRSGRHATM